MRIAGSILLAALCLALAACGGDDDREEEGTPGGVAGATGFEEPAEPQEAPEGPAETGADGDGDGEEEGNGGDPRRSIRGALEDALSSGDPKLACGTAVTEAYIRESYGDAAGCRGAQSPEFAARIVDVEPISIEGDVARATLRAEGGPYAGERLRAELVREGADWKLDRLRSSVPAGP